MNLLEEMDEFSSRSYVRRVMARTLGHAVTVMGITWPEAREVWEDSGNPAETWDAYWPSMRAA